MLFKQYLALAISLALSDGMLVPAIAQDTRPPDSAAPEPGFYGGIALRPSSQSAIGVNLGKLDLAWSKFVAPTADETASRSLIFGGYRWRSDLAVEAAFASTETYALAPLGQHGVGISLAGTSDPAAARSWNADLYTSWAMVRSLSLYGRLGYAQSEAAPGYAVAMLAPGDFRRARDGVNYGVGVRYDVTRALGLRLEYARFGRFTGETVGGSVLPESDQVQLGLQLRF